MIRALTACRLLIVSSALAAELPFSWMRRKRWQLFRLALPTAGQQRAHVAQLHREQRRNAARIKNRLLERCRSRLPSTDRLHRSRGRGVWA